MDIGYIIIILLIIIVIVLLITNFIKLNQFSALQMDTYVDIKSDNKSNNKSDNKSDNKADKLAMYYTNWCGISQQFKPIWDKFCQETKTGIDTVSINCENNNICRNFGIKGYPTVILHKVNGDNIEFTQNRTVQDLENFVNNNKS